MVSTCYSEYSYGESLKRIFVGKIVGGSEIGMNSGEKVVGKKGIDETEVRKEK